jgi:hypothetical protein
VGRVPCTVLSDHMSSTVATHRESQALEHHQRPFGASLACIPPGPFTTTRIQVKTLATIRCNAFESSESAAGRCASHELCADSLYCVHGTCPRNSVLLAAVVRSIINGTLGLQMWKGLSVVTDSPSPIVVVLSGSMEPAFQRGDLLFLWNRNILADTAVGEVVVYNVRGKDIPIVHRVVRKFGSGYVCSGL